MIRFEKKTWFARSLREIERVGSKVLLREGRAKKKVGSPWDPIEEAKTTEHPFPHVHAARRFVRDTGVRWSSEGYQEFAASSGKPREPYSAKRNRGLEDEVLREGMDGSAIHVLADWLIESGDPRGALMQEMLHDEAMQAIQDQATELLWRDEGLSEAESCLLKAAYDAVSFSFVWKAGFVETCWIESPIGMFVPASSESDLVADAIALESALFRTSSFAFLRKLVRVISTDVTGGGGMSVEAFPFPVTLRSLRLETAEDGEMEEVTPVSRCYRHLPALSELSLWGMREFDLGSEIALPNLRILSLEPRILTGANIQSLVNSALPKLERLTLCFFDAHEWEESDFTVRDLVPLFETESLPSLNYLDLRGTMPSDDYFDVLEALLASPILRQLSTLSLQSYFFHTVEMANASLDLFLRNKDKLTHLEILDLSKDAKWAQWFPESATDPKLRKRAEALRGLAKRVIL